MSLGNATVRPISKKQDFTEGIGIAPYAVDGVLRLRC